MGKVNFVFVIATFFSIGVFAQEFEKELSEDQLLRYKDEVKFNYDLFHESVINILDEDLTLEQRYIARLVLFELFANSNSTIQDYLDGEDILKRYKISEYSYKLFDLENKLPILNKSYKFSDSIYITSSTQSIQEKYIKLPEEERLKKFFNVYKGEVFFVEKSTASTDEKLFDLSVKESLKTIKFRIIHDEYDTYKLEFQHIENVDKKREKSNYNEVLTSSNPWSKEVEELTLQKILAEAETRDFKLPIPDTGSIVDQKEKIQDELVIEDSKLKKLRPIKFHEYLIPGIGHSHFNSSISKKVRKWSYLGLFAGSAGTAFYFWNKGKSEYSKADLAMSLDDRKKYEEKGLKNYNNARVFGVAAGLVFITNIMHLEALKSKRKRLAKEAGYKNIGFHISNEADIPTLGLTFNF